MFSRENYKSVKVGHEDIYNGILMFLFLILSSITTYTIISYDMSYDIYNKFMGFILISDILIFGKIIFILVYDGTNENYIEKYKKKINCLQLLKDIPILIISLYTIITNFYTETVEIICLFNYYTILSFIEIGFIIYNL